jgi:hypothetical protein
MSVMLHQQVLVDTGKLQGAPYNPRMMPDGEMTNLMNSLLEFGFVEPVVARKEDGLVIGGHQRLEAFKRLHADGKVKGSRVPVVWLEGLSDDRAKLLNVALNRIGGEWDYQKLAQLLQSLDDDSHAVLTGFGQEEIDDILTLTQQEAETVLPDLADTEANIDEALRGEARKFAFAVATDEDAQLCRDVLEAHGMTGPGNSGAAFVAALKASKLPKVKK